MISLTDSRLAFPRSIQLSIHYSTNSSVYYGPATVRGKRISWRKQWKEKRTILVPSPSRHLIAVIRANQLSSLPTNIIHKLRIICLFHRGTAEVK